MKVVKCDQCGVEIPSRQGFELLVAPDGERAYEDFCTPTCLERWLHERFPEKRPDFAAAHERIGGPVSQSPLPTTTRQRITVVELVQDEADQARADDALDDALDAGALDPPGPLLDHEGEPFDPIAIIGRKARPAGMLSSLPGPDVARMIRDNRETGS